MSSGGEVNQIAPVEWSASSEYDASPNCETKCVYQHTTAYASVYVSLMYMYIYIYINASDVVRR